VVQPVLVQPVKIKPVKIKSVIAVVVAVFAPLAMMALKPKTIADQPEFIADEVEPGIITDVSYSEMLAVACTSTRSSSSRSPPCGTT
jgi:hypothetical protein